jgi:hypothetical protein
MALIVFCLGAAMYAYDLVGHGLCLAAHTWAPVARAWNAHAHRVWPVRVGRDYERFWTLWHATALLAMMVGFLLR